MRFDVRYPDGTAQTEDLTGRLVIVGRDPSCDLVLRDPKCSRRHAVIEQTPEGVLVRDSGSINGIYVNERRVERALLQPGDEIRMGEVRLTLAPEGADRPLLASVSSPLVDLPLPGSETMLAPIPANDNRRAPAARPLPITVLAAVWAAAAPLIAALAVAAAWARGPFDATGVALLAGGALAGVAALLLAGGLFLGQPWARVLHLVLCLPLALTCLATPFALVAAAYLMGVRAQLYFDGVSPRRDPRRAASARVEVGFACALAGAAVLTLVAGALAGHFLREPFSSLATNNVRRDAPVLDRLRVMTTAQESFRRVCNIGYADLESLLDPASVIPSYPPRGAAFLNAAEATPEAHGYRFVLAVRDPLPPTDDCQTLRRYRSFEYRATPVFGFATHYLLTTTGLIHAAQGRPARTDDPTEALRSGPR